MDDEILLCSLAVVCKPDQHFEPNFLVRQSVLLLDEHPFRFNFDLERIHINLYKFRQPERESERWVRLEPD